MKRSALTILIIAMYITISTFVATYGKAADSNEAEFHKPARQTQTKEPNDTNGIRPPHRMQQIQEAETQGQISQEMTEAWKKVEKESNDEIKQWSKPGINERLSLAKAVQSTARAELILIRKIAKEENAKQTVEAIDKILATRNKRLDYIMAKAQEEEKTSKEQIQRERTERKRLSVEERRRLIEERRNRLRTRRDTDGSTEN